MRDSRTLIFRLMPDSLRGRIRLFSLLLIALPVFTSALLFGVFLKGRAEEQERFHLDVLLEQYTAEADDWLGRCMADVTFLAESEEARHLQLERLGRLLTAFSRTHQGFIALSYVDARGFTVLDPSGVPTGMDLSDRSYFLAARRGDSTITDVITSRATGLPVLVFAAPVRGPERDFRGLILGASSPAALDQMARLAATSEGRIIRILDRKGERVTGRSGPLAGVVGPPLESPLRELVFRNAPLPPMYADHAGRIVVGRSKTLKDGQWVAVAETPLSVVHAGVWNFLTVAVLAALAVITLLTPALLRLTRSVEAPLEEMARMARAMEEDRPDMDCAPGAFREAPDEIRTLYDAFVHMTGKLRDTISQLAVCAITDPLTALANRRSLMDEGRRLAGVCRRSGIPFSVLMIDLDGFKQINDTLGHQAGDEVLRHVADQLRASARSTDFVARYGGEEFVVLAPGADAAQALSLAERLRAAVESEACPLDIQSVLCTVSIGTATLDGAGTPDEALETALGRADQALYRAKDAGRNRVEAFGPASPGS